MLAIDYVSVDRLVDYRENSWTQISAGFVPTWDMATLQAEIDRKNSKPRSYRASYSEIWLLLVSAFVGSAWMEMPDKIANAEFQTSFTRVFLLSSFHSRRSSCACVRNISSL